MAKGTRNTAIAFGSFELAVSLVKAEASRDVRTEYVDEAGRTVTMGGGAAGGSRTPAAGVSKAVRVSDSHVVRLPPGELAAIEAESKDRWGAMRVLECIDYRQCPTHRIKGSYWLQPAQGSAQGLYLLHHALRDREKVAVVKWVATSREKLGVLRPRLVRRGGEYFRGLLLSELVFANDFTAPDEDVLSLDVAGRMLEEHDSIAHMRAVDASRELIDAFTRQPGDDKAIDLASNGAVDARLALLERLQAEALTAGLEAATGAADVIAIREPQAA